MTSDWERGFNTAFFIGIIAVIIITVMALLVQSGSNDSAWANGWCTALTGQVITNDVCNIEGRVVAIPERP